MGKWWRVCWENYLTTTNQEIPDWLGKTTLLGEISITSDKQMTPPLWQKAKRNWRASFWKWKKRVKKLVQNSIFKKKDRGIWFYHFWQIDGETMDTVTDFIFFGSKITADGDYSHEIKRCLFLGRKTMTNLDSILKTRDITLPTNVHLVKAMVFQ